MMSSPSSQRASTIYAIVQSVLFIGFALTVFITNGARLLPRTGTTQWVAGALCVAGLLAMFAAFPAIGEAVQVAPAPKPGATLVTRGIYRWLRHPMYSGILAIIVGVFVRTPTLPVGVAAVVVIAFLAVKVRFEEKLLAATYPEYAVYKRRTRGLFPFVRG